MSTTIRVSVETAKKLENLKRSMNAKSIEEVFNHTPFFHIVFHKSASRE